MATPPTPTTRRTQADRRAQTRSALLEAAARGLSRYGYSNLVLSQVAAEAGYTRGALYHLFDGKDDLVLAVLDWVEEAWYAEVGVLFDDADDPVAALVAIAQGHAVFCRRDIARLMITLRVEFSGQDHPLGRRLREVERKLLTNCARLITAGRRSGAIPPGPPVKAMASAYFGAVEGLVINLAHSAPADTLLAARAALGILGLPPSPAPAPTTPSP